VKREQPVKPCVLVVDDDPETQGFMRVLLGGRYDVRVASSGEEMRRQLAAAAGAVRLVLMDLSLKGGEDGLELTRALRKEEGWKKLPVVAVTAHAFATDRTKALAAGCDAYVEKPIDNERLLSLIQRLMAGS
jgi:CheY-like chemotaxis protein